MTADVPCLCAECDAVRAKQAPPAWSESCPDFESCLCPCSGCLSNIHVCGHAAECHIRCREGVLVPA